jgi:DNA polymerase-4
MIYTAKPYIMHIDLNSCFAIIEQQANRLLRGRPVGVAAYDTPRGFVLAASYEAKRMGVKLGVNVAQAREMCPGIVILTPDPAKYREAHRRFNELLLEFTPDVVPKSIDEFVLDFSGSQFLKNQNMEYGSRNIEGTSSQPILDSTFFIPDSAYSEHCARMEAIGRRIKQRVKEVLGEWVTVNVGIGPNRFLAKYAAGFGKPDGMTVITQANLEAFYCCGDLTTCARLRKNSSRQCTNSPMELVDLPGINVRYAARLKACGINTPLEFFAADERLLKKTVFKSVVGYYWWARLRGHEVDNRSFTTKSIGHQYAIPKKTSDKKELERLLMKLCEKVGRRLRKKNVCARGIHLYLGFEKYRDDVVVDKAYAPGTNTDYVVGAVGFDQMNKMRSWHEGRRLEHRLYATSDIFQAARTVLSCADIALRVKLMAITVYDLEPWDPEQLSIFDRQVQGDEATKQHEGHKTPIQQTEYRGQEALRRLSDAMDMLNDRYGEFVITPATMMDMRGEILDRIAFSNRPEPL